MRSNRASGPTAARATARSRSPPACPAALSALPSLLLDIDTGADLLALRERLAGADVRAAHARRLGQGERADALDHDPG